VNVVVGTEIPAWDMPSVEAARMRTMAAILRDPYPVHWDRDANERIGFGGRVINQGPLNLGYIVNMLHAWTGPGSVRRLTVRFGAPVLDEDHVTAHGKVTAIDEVGGERRATCEVWLARDGVPIVTGSAVVALP
jgi:acyl dehydratase